MVCFSDEGPELPMSDPVWLVKYRREVLKSWSCWTLLRENIERFDPQPYVPVYDPHYGEDGVRDSANPCDMYKEVSRKRHLGVVQPPWGTCQSDGHYMCKDCLHCASNEVRGDDFSHYPSLDEVQD